MDITIQLIVAGWIICQPININIIINNIELTSRGTKTAWVENAENPPANPYFQLLALLLGMV